MGPADHGLAAAVKGEGCVVELEGGRLIAGPTATQNPDGCHWLAVYGAGGALLFHSTWEQWEHDPVGEMTRFADAATNGRPARINLPLTRLNSETLDYGPECAATITATTQVLRFSAAPQECDYVRITAAEGKELLYWTSDEWREEPEEVIGALLGACRSGAKTPPPARPPSPRRRRPA
jgi:hypothetical protein